MVRAAPPAPRTRPVRNPQAVYVKSTVEECALRWLAEVEAVEEPTAISLLTEQGGVAGTLIACEGELCFGVANLSRSFVEGRLDADHVTEFRHTHREAQLRGIALDAGRVGGDFDRALHRGVMVRLIRLVVSARCAVAGVGEPSTRSERLPSTRLTRRSRFSAIELYTELVQREGGEEDEVHRFVGAVGGKAEQVWDFERRALTEPLQLRGTSRIGDGSLRQVQLVRQGVVNVLGRLPPQAADEMGLPSVVLITGDGFWCYVVSPTRVAALRFPLVRLGMVTRALSRVQEVDSGIASA